MLFFGDLAVWLGQVMPVKLNTFEETPTTVVLMVHVPNIVNFCIELQYSIWKNIKCHY